MKSLIFSLILIQTSYSFAADPGKRIAPDTQALIAGKGAATVKDGTIALNPEKTYIDVTLGAKLPILLFFTHKNLAGYPKIELNNDGLLIDSKLVCTWPGGTYSGRDSVDMVLGFSASFNNPKAKQKYKPCPESPVRSTWSDGGEGGAALYVEVEKVEGDVATAMLKGKEIYLSLKAMPGKYKVRKPGELVPLTITASPAPNDSSTSGATPDTGALTPTAEGATPGAKAPTATPAKK